MSDIVRKRHNANVMLYHIVCPTKFRRIVLNNQIDILLKNTCIQIALRYDMNFVEIGTDKDHVHFLVQSVPVMSGTRIVTIIKSITAREIFSQYPLLKKDLWGSEFWSDGYYIATVGRKGNETVISNYVKEQGREKEYAKLHRSQLTLFG